MYNKIIHLKRGNVLKFSFHNTWPKPATNPRPINNFSWTFVHAIFFRRDVFFIVPTALITNTGVSVSFSCHGPARRNARKILGNRVERTRDGNRMISPLKFSTINCHLSRLHYAGHSYPCPLSRIPLFVSSLQLSLFPSSSKFSVESPRVALQGRRRHLFYKTEKYRRHQ